MRIHRLNPFILCLFLALLASLPSIQGQGAATFETEGPTKEIPEGTRFELAFSLKNTAAKRFIPPDFNGFRVTGGPSELRGAGFVNGKSYSHQTWTYELEAGPPGVYTIGSATVQTASQTLRTQPLIIRVGKAAAGKAKAPPNSPDDRLFISAELDRETAWLGQQLLYQVKLYTQVGVSDYDILDLPTFEGFFAQERRRFDTRTQYQTIKGKRYVVRILHETSLFPQQTGVLRIGSAQVRLGVEQPGTLSAMLGGKPVLVQTQPVKIEVKALPEPVPDNFSGGVGAYNWQVTADKDSLTTDDALTLSIRIEGNGDARRFANPRLELPMGLEGLDPKIQEQEEYETGEQFVHARTLEYVVLPKEPGNYTLLPELVVFDPDSNKYRNLQAAAPINIRVAIGKFYGKNALPVDTIALAPTTNRSWWNGLVERVSSGFLTPFLWTLAGGLLLVVLGLVWRRTQRRQPGPIAPLEPAPVRPTLKTLRQRLKQLSGAVQGNNSPEFYHDLLKIIEGYIAVCLNADPGQLSKDIVREKLTERRVPEATTRVLLQLWQHCEQAVFAGQPVSTDLNALLYKAETSLSQLEQALNTTLPR